MKACSAIVHAGPALGAKFTQYTAEFEAGGELGSTPAQRFIFVIEGGVKLEVERQIERTGRARLRLFSRRLAASSDGHENQPCRRHREALSGSRFGRSLHSSIVSSEDAVSSHPLDDDPSLQVKCLLPDEMNFDFAVNTMVYQPGAALSMVEMHVMEHGLIMLEGGGIYRLGDSWYPVTAGDFIWMGPWCPQWFGAIGKVPAKYLIYKDWNRHPLAGTQLMNLDDRPRSAALRDRSAGCLISDAEPPR